MVFNCCVNFFIFLRAILNLVTDYDLKTFRKQNPFSPTDSAERGAASPNVRPSPTFQYHPSLGTISQVQHSYPAPSVSYTQPYQGTQVTWAGNMPSSQGVPLLVQTGSPQGTPQPGSISQPVLFAAPNIESVPPGSVLINPQTGE